MASPFVCPVTESANLRSLFLQMPFICNQSLLSPESMPDLSTCVFSTTASLVQATIIFSIDYCDSLLSISSVKQILILFCLMYSSQSKSLSFPRSEGSVYLSNHLFTTTCPPLSFTGFLSVPPTHQSFSPLGKRTFQDRVPAVTFVWDALATGLLG